MPLIIHLTPNDPALDERAARRIEVGKRLTIGRGADNDVVLPDPNRHLSKLHCVIDADGDRYTITDKSTNGVFLGDSADRLPRDTPTPLAAGSVLRMGGYQITVTAAIPSLPQQEEQRAESHPVAPHVPPLAPAGDGLFGDPLAAPIAPGTSGSSEGLQGLGAPHLEPPLGPLIPDDFDPQADAPAQSQRRGASQPDHAPAESDFFEVPNVKIEKIPDDWDASMLSPGSGGPARLPQRKAEFEEPDRGNFGLPSPAPQSARAAQGGDDPALASFLAAVGLSGAALSDPEKLRLMRLAGEMLKVMVGGIIEILAARATTKQEFRIERTTVGAMRNNPLKFCAGLDEAMRILLIERRPGFLSGKEAVEEALGDIKGHQLAVLAGMQVALTTIVNRLDPANLERRLEQGSLIEGILPAARKARFWDLFKALYKDIAEELEEDFQKAFGAEFARAYQEQLDRL